MVKWRRKLSVLLIVAMLVVVLTLLSACSGSNNGTGGTSSSSGSSSSGAKQQDTLSGKITASGSTAMLPLVEEAAARFMDKHPNVIITVQGGGSGTGLSQVSEGAVDIGNSDVFAEEKIKDPAKVKELVDHQFIAQGFAAVAHKDVGVDNLTKQQMKDIFLGKITNWKDVGGKDQKIVVVNRPTSSGTRTTFVNLVLDGQQPIEGNTLTGDSSGAVLKTVAETPGAISYLGLAYLDNTVIVLKLDGVAPTIDNIVAGKYPIWSFGHMYTKGEPPAGSVLEAFMDYMASDEVAKLAKDNGYVGGSDAVKMQKK